jgi:hypothetical protein
MLLKGLGTHFADLSLKIIVDNRWYFGVTTDLLSGRISATTL